MSLRGVIFDLLSWLWGLVHKLVTLSPHHRYHTWQNVSCGGDVSSAISCLWPRGPRPTIVISLAFAATPLVFSSGETRAHHDLA